MNTNNTLLSLDLVTVAPGDNFTPLPLPDGEGIHTGGLWRSPCGNFIWKPLDCHPYANAPHRLPTLEAECLRYLQGCTGFLDNWRVEQANGRSWLVRPYCPVIGQSFPIEQIEGWMIDQVEDAVRSLNAHHWQAFNCGDLSVAIDPHLQVPFLLDLSNAHFISAQSQWKADDSSAFYKWLRSIGWSHRADLREQGRSLLHSREWLTVIREDNSGRFDRHRHVYRLQQAIVPFNEVVLLSYKDCWWLVAPTCLTPEQCDRYSATWAWSPIAYRPQPLWLALHHLLDTVESWYRHQILCTHQQTDLELIKQAIAQVDILTEVVPEELSKLHAPFVVIYQEVLDELVHSGKPTGFLVECTKQ
jgi:hypothetical protein